MPHISDRRGVIELPFRLVVTTVIGGVVLGLIGYYISTNCLLMKEMQVIWKPSVVEIKGENGSCEIEIEVRDENKNPIKNAVVTVTGLGGADSGITGKNGSVLLNLSLALENRREGYLNIRVTYNKCYRDFYEENAIKVIRVDGNENY